MYAQLLDQHSSLPPPLDWAPRPALPRPGGGCFSGPQASSARGRARLSSSWASGTPGSGGGSKFWPENPRGPGPELPRTQPAAPTPAPRRRHRPGRESHAGPGSALQPPAVRLPAVLRRDRGEAPPGSPGSRGEGVPGRSWTSGSPVQCRALVEAPRGDPDTPKGEVRAPQGGPGAHVKLKGKEKKSGDVCRPEAAGRKPEAAPQGRDGDAPPTRAQRGPPGAGDRGNLAAR